VVLGYKILYYYSLIFYMIYNLFHIHLKSVFVMLLQTLVVHTMK